LVRHTAEVEDIVYEWENLKDVFVWEIKSCKAHPDSEKLHCTIVEVNWQNLQIVCWASNVRAGLKVPVALVW
jgi:phenylalanyl-tRNA synthetase beta chain